jgi:hypothetical protein
MPAKSKRTKKTITVETVEEPEKQTIMEKVENLVTSITACGHQNMHAEGELLCILPKGHKGNHQNGSEWSDAAGVPVKKRA